MVADSLTSQKYVINVKNLTFFAIASLQSYTYIQYHVFSLLSFVKYLYLRTYSSTLIFDVHISY